MTVSMLIGIALGLAVGYAFGWQHGRAIYRQRTDRHDNPTCDGTSPCATCQDRNECGKAGCIRIAARNVGKFYGEGVRDVS